LNELKEAEEQSKKINRESTKMAKNIVFTWIDWQFVWQKLGEALNLLLFFLQKLQFLNQDQYRRK
jgi:hypothetical protein